MSSSSKQLNGVMLAALMVFKSLDVERARLTYNLCYSKRKMVCRKHYREAATCIADEVTMAVGGLPSQGNYTRFLSQGFEIPHHLLESLNTHARQLEESLLITPANIGHFVDGSFSPLNQSEGTESFDQNIFGKRRRVMHEKKLDEENVTAPITESDVKVRLSVSSAEDVSTNHKDLFLGGVVKTEEP
ncbi:unnamed protein product [Heligmosomoides polygyrus]|uniref:CPG4 domain-containing protein n=1 Tax=Heligmosomoides polygyrus TaxID=6339 RepID=A0A183F3P1_HELPZ|nr:unnamed protein product [Heligmosomoides polygyrus]